MQLGMIGLGRMGNGMTDRLREHDHDVRTYDPAVESRTAASLEELKSQLDAPRAFWMMIPAGKITEDTFQELLEARRQGRHDRRRRQLELPRLAAAPPRGGRARPALRRRRHLGRDLGPEEGFCTMVGGDDEPVQRLEPIFTALAPEDGYAHVGASGAGHFTKMVHNGIEYGLMQAYAEGFQVIEHSEFDVDLHELAGIWRYGSVVRSWLLDLLYSAFETHGNKLDDIAPYVEDSGEGRWTIEEAINEKVPVPVMSAALFARFASRDEENFAARVTAALRNQFGGHAIKAK